eukprot:1397871-Pyramimonas_sp.AAC.1
MSPRSENQDPISHAGSLCGLSRAGSIKSGTFPQYVMHSAGIVCTQSTLGIVRVPELVEMRRRPHATSDERS